VILENLVEISTQSYLTNIFKSDKIVSSLLEYRFSFSSEKFVNYLWEWN